MTIQSTAAGLAALVALASGAAHAQDLAALEEAAKAEGMLTTIALPHDWCGYGAADRGLQEEIPRNPGSTS